MNLRSLIPIGRERNVSRGEFTRSFRLPAAGNRPPVRRFHARLADVHDERLELTPRMDVAETDKEIEITAELPGLEEKDVQVNIADNVLTIKGEKKAEKREGQELPHVRTRSYGSFSRTLELPAGVNAHAIKANIVERRASR